MIGWKIMTINDLYINAKAISLEEIFVDVIENHEQHLIDLNHGQLQQGQDSEGEYLREYQSIAYALEKYKMNSSAGFGNPDLRYTGAFYSGWSLYIDTKGFFYDSGDDKTSDLVAKYGENIFGLRKDNLEAFVDNDFRLDFFTILNEKLSR
mgnify:CR=1 FL=1